MKRLLIAGAIVLATPAVADDSAKAGVDVALQFTQCAGLFYASADLGLQFGQSPDDVQLMHELGNGAALSAQYVLAQVRALSQPGDTITPEIWNRAWKEGGDYVNCQVASNRVAWRSLLRGSGNPQVARQAEICAGLNELQTELVQEMRQKMLTAPWGEDAP